MNTKLFLLLGTSLSLIPTLTFAQCVATQDCETLGYTETSCNGGKGVKCPFGNKWACIKSDSECEQQFCDKYGFQYTCSGTGYSGGSGTACGGKYTACTCANGYEWNGSTCQKQILNGAQGDLYYCNGTVVGVKAGDMDFYVAMKDLEDMNWYDANSRCQSTQFCTHSYGTLPSTSHFYSIYQNKTNLDNLLSSNKGTAVTGRYWTSSIYNKSDNSHFTSQISTSSINNYGPGGGNNSNEYKVRPILTSR